MGPGEDLGPSPKGSDMIRLVFEKGHSGSRQNWSWGNMGGIQQREGGGPKPERVDGTKWASGEVAGGGIDWPRSHPTLHC